MAEINGLLSKGLEQGYAGGTERQTAQRGPFKLESSQLITPEGGIYIDQWIADRTGGGQEIVQIGNEKSTRLYAGGTIGIGELQKLGLTKKDVTKKLKQFIKEAGSKTRLMENYTPQSDGDWQYSYEIINALKEIPLTVGMETIKFRGTLVFAHGFLRSPIE
ncbi:MAG: hypothetical protein AAB662_02970 [Patescibacteria group bacterium]